MDPFENSENNETSETGDLRCDSAQSQPVSQDETPSQPRQDSPSSAYHGSGTGRKESPYANSPYIMQPSPEPYTRPRPQLAEKPGKVKKNRKPLWKPVLACLLVIALVAAGCFFTTRQVNGYWNNRVEFLEMEISQLQNRLEELEQQRQNLPASGHGSAALPGAGSTMTPAQLYASQVDSVVAISSTIQSYYGSGSSSGSGFVLSEDGYIITNYHVVEDASSVDVILHDGTEYPAQLVGKDSSNDLAVLKVEATGLSAATLGSSTDLAIGDMVVAIGNPLGELAATQTVGYVSGIDREVSTGSVTTISMIQTDAAINPGNSGGPLFNMYGEVIGITTAKYSGTTNSGASIEGIGFAIPIDDVEPLIEDLIDYGYVTGAYLGVSIQNTDEEAAAQFGIPTGAYVVTVEEGGAAQRAGIQPKDIIIGLGAYDVSNATDLTRALRKFSAGDTTSVRLIRGGKELTLEITLDERPQETTVETTPQPESPMPSDDSFDELYDYFRRFFGG